MPPSVLTIGQFDGVHVGHAAILRLARELAAGRGARVVALTFDRHPAAVLAPGSEPPFLIGTDHKSRLLREAGADEVVVLGPTREDLAQTAEAFVERLVRDYAPVAVVEGEDFRFGRGRTGDVGTLRDLGRRHGFAMHVVPKAKVPLSDYTLAPVSSSLVRWLVGRGRVRDAAACLGRPFSLTARVVTGDRQGRTLEIPTANLDPADLEGFILPADGVYAGYATLDGAAYAAAISVGDKPTFRGRAFTIEAHLLDYRPEPFDALYGRTITLAFTHWLRDQYAFPGLDPLKAQLAVDLADTRRLAPHL